MNNYEKIKNMSIDEMAEFLKNKNCADGCTIPTHIKCENCIDYLKQWLKSEEE